MSASDKPVTYVGIFFTIVILSRNKQIEIVIYFSTSSTRLKSYTTSSFSHSRLGHFPCFPMPPTSHTAFLIPSWPAPPLPFLPSITFPFHFTPKRHPFFHSLQRKSSAQTHTDQSWSASVHLYDSSPEKYFPPSQYEKLYQHVEKEKKRMGQSSENGGLVLNL